MISNDLLLSIASMLYVICAVPQLIRNLRFKDTITQSIFSNLLIFFATLVSLIAYINLNLFSASVFLLLELLLTFILIIQIIIWRKNKKKMKHYVEKTEGARAIIKSIKGVK
jgi:ABC-type bacteriocin/lantibiotic exporter with double-glycine peptidase domain